MVIFESIRYIPSESIIYLISTDIQFGRISLITHHLINLFRNFENGTKESAAHSVSLPTVGNEGNPLPEARLHLSTKLS